MTRTLTIVSGAGIVVLLLLPIYYADDLQSSGEVAGFHHAGAKALLVSVVVFLISISGALAILAIRLFDRYFRG